MTVFKPADPNHKRMIATLIGCSEEIDENWLQKLRSEAPQVAGEPAA